MKVNISIKYAEQTKTWEGLEFKDNATWEEVFDNFMSNFSIEAMCEETGEALSNEEEIPNAPTEL